MRPSWCGRSTAALSPSIRRQPWHGTASSPSPMVAMSQPVASTRAFVSPESAEWLDANPLETGEMITIDRALCRQDGPVTPTDPKACKIGECAPK